MWLEREGQWLYFVDPATNKRLQLPEEVERERANAAEEERDALADERDAERKRAEAALAALQAAQQELAELRNRLPKESPR